MLYGLQVARGLAALMVILYHADLNAEFFYGIPFKGLFRFGYIGVDFFFVLSGFIIFYVNYKKDTGFSQWKKYILKRLIRIYPAVFLVSLVMVVSYKLLPGLSNVQRDFSIISSLLLLPANNPPALMVAWTLIHEMIFYMVFSLFFIKKKIFYLFLFCWVIIIFSVSITGLETQRITKYFISSHNLEFIMGAFTAWIILNNKIKKQSISLLGPFLLFVFIINEFLGLVLICPDLKILYLGICFSIIVIGIYFFDLKEHKYPEIFIYLGAASYSIYLIHDPCLSILNRVAAKFNYMPSEIIFINLSLFCVIAGCLFYKFYEKPVLDFLKSRIARHKD